MHGNFHDLTNQRFGRLIVLQRDTTRIRPVHWLCLCKCKRQTSVDAGSLTSGRTQSCGCLAAEITSARRRLRPYEWLFRHLCVTATSCARPVYLTYAEFIRFTKRKTCEYCGAEIVWSKYKRRSGTTYSECRYNLDRKNNEPFYSVENCIVCCPRCNRAKSNCFTYTEWYGMTEWLRRQTCRVKQKS